ncbi:MAG: ADP-ribosylglycohydrolase family protein [Candidatus Dormiibacterota bacterium]
MHDTQQHDRTLPDRILGCLLSGLIGDAMGTPSENLAPEEIERQWGWIDDFEGSGTDDTLLRNLLCQAIIESDGWVGPEDWAAQWLAHRADILGRRDKFFISTLHTLERLRRGVPARESATGNLPSSTSAMAIAPIGIVCGGHPRRAALQAQGVASLMHTGPAAFCQDAAAAMAAAVAAAMCENATAEASVRAATACLGAGAGEMRGLIESALELAVQSGDYREFRSRYASCFRRSIACDSRETVPAALALVWLADGSPKQAIEFGANFGRDADTIATMAGGIAGALAGASALPGQWRAKIAPEDEQQCQRLAEGLLEVGTRAARRELEWARDWLEWADTASPTCEGRK